MAFDRHSYLIRATKCLIHACWHTPYIHETCILDKYYENCSVVIPPEIYRGCCRPSLRYFLSRRLDRYIRVGRRNCPSAMSPLHHPCVGFPSANIGSQSLGHQSILTEETWVFYDACSCWKVLWGWRILICFGWRVLVFKTGSQNLCADQRYRISDEFNHCGALWENDATVNG